MNISFDIAYRYSLVQEERSPWAWPDFVNVKRGVCASGGAL